MSENATALIIGAIDSKAPIRLSTVGFASNGTGSALASGYFEGVITGDITAETNVSCVFWGGRSGFSISQITLINDDGGLDWLLYEPIKGRAIEIKTGETSDKWEDWALDFYGTVEGIDFTDALRPRLSIANGAAAFEKPFQPLTYSGVNSAIDGKTKPLSYGFPLNVPPVLTDPSLLEFDVGPDTTALRVRDNGAELTPTTQWTQAAGVVTIITLNQAVVGKITADLDGDDNGRLLQLCQLVMTQAGLNPADIGAISLENTAEDYLIGFWADSPVTCAQVLDKAVDSYAGWWWVDNAGDLRIGQLKAPGTPVLNIGPDDFAQGILPGARQDQMPGFSKVLALQKNYFVHNTSEIATVLTDPTYTQIALDLQADYRIRVTGGTAGSPTADQERETDDYDGARVTTKSTGIGTLLTDETEAQAEADRWLALRDVRRSFYDITVILSLADIRALEIGDTVNVTAPLNAEGITPARKFNLDSTNLLVIGFTKTINSNTVKLKLWGGEGPGDPAAPTYRYWRLVVESIQTPALSVTGIEYFKVTTTAGGASLFSGGTPSASTEYSPPYSAEKAFVDDSTYWANTNTSFPAYVQYDTGAGQEISAAYLEVRAYPPNHGFSPKLLKLLVSNDATFTSYVTAVSVDIAGYTMSDTYVIDSSGTLRIPL